MSILFRGISEISVRKALQAQHAISLFSHTTWLTSYRKNLFLMSNPFCESVRYQVENLETKRVF